LLCTFRGERFLAEQLKSIASQTRQDWQLWASDDGSDDRTLAIIEDFKKEQPVGKVYILHGPQSGIVANFLSLVCNPALRARYFAFCDQDDVWHPLKLERAINQLSKMGDLKPTLYCGRTLNVDESNVKVSESPLFPYPPCFQNALVQSIAGGNTMMFNLSARRLLQFAGPHVVVIAHDWWVYLVVTACGGEVFYDPESTIMYRQHDRNSVGASSSFGDRLGRVLSSFQGKYITWIDNNLMALQKLQQYLTEDNLQCLKQFEACRAGSLKNRVIKFRRSGVFRQTTFGNLSLALAIVLKKI
jgi:glycosyltransferase involved in cell wall biosynthesis